MTEMPADHPEGREEVLQIIGLCRFSVPGIGGFQTEHGTIEARRAMLYDPARLDRRLAWFEHVCLPGLRAQTDPDFTLVLLLGEDLPEPWRGRVLALVADVPQIVVEYAPPGPHREICAEAMRRHVHPEATVLAQFRLDDDDAVAGSFVARTRRDLAAVLGILDHKRNFALDYVRGLVLRWDGELMSYEPRFAHLWTAGLVFVNRPADDRFILDTRHDRMWYYMPVVSQSDEIMFLRGAHGGNDSPIGRGRDRYPLSEERFETVLRKRFHVDLEALARRLLDIAAART
ncbi:putative rhamnosyl transferase [Frigidibacter sp. ROC022]|uniref:putative rhamnosyl transferase n=1 Tax=Frigidibacter sp. ROC022 TaxID=2971796 RepID=UPI00215A13D0|nr:putative rhamnosyl transferase [Frigidibacter sp. ROC022]MCR8726542.1 putative rhamnosyl transferase [Frigidibacter sp. ROC022]